MKIKKIEFRNFMSYGNKWQTIIFDDGSLSLILGKNGFGKSTLRQVIEYGLYGKILGKTLKDIPNRLNKSLEVKIEVEASNKKINIHRGLEPSFFKVNVEGISDFDMRDKAAVQNDLESLYGIPYNIFNNTMSLSINDFKSFIKMKPEDKRKIIDKIFGLSIINMMRETLKNDLKVYKNRQNNTKIQIKSINDEIERITSKIEDMKISIEETNINRSEEIINSLKKYNKLHSKLKSKKDKLLEYLKEFNEDYNSINNKINKLQRIIGSLKEKLELFENDKCPTCGSDLHNESFDSLKEDYEQELKMHKDNYSLLKNERENIENEISNINDMINENKDKIYNVTIEINKLQSEMEMINENVDNQINSLEDLRENSIEKLNLVKESLQETENELNFIQLMDEMLSENGIKKLAMKIILPTMNNQLKILTKTLGIPYNVKFDANFDSIITHNGEVISAITLSTGETKKVDSAILIAIIKLMKLKFSGLNFLFLDEIFSSLDTESVHNIISITKKMSSELKLNIFVVNHAPLDTNQFDYIYQVTKNNSYSNIEEISNI